MNEIRSIERDAARDGTVLSAVYRPDKVEVRSKQTHKKRSLQEEYVRKFDAEVTVMLPDEPGGEAREQTLQEYHSRRLLGK